MSPPAEIYYLLATDVGIVIEYHTVGIIISWLVLLWTAGHAPTTVFRTFPHNWCRSVSTTQATILRVPGQLYSLTFFSRRLSRLLLWTFLEDSL